MHLCVLCDCVCACVCVCMHVRVLFRRPFKPITGLTTAALTVTVYDGRHGENNPVAVIDNRVDKLVLDDV